MYNINMKVIIVGSSDNYNQEFEYRMQELKELCHALNFEVVDSLFQKLRKRNPKHYLNHGKVLELREMVDKEEADGVVFLDELTGSQIRNLIEMLECTVLDKTNLILDIFAKRAKTKESQIQVKIATRQYEMTKLIGRETSIYSQQGGSGFRGKGEKQLELNKRDIKHRITILNRQLKDAVKQRQTQRKQRSHNDIKQVALVGYTNSGKSTMLNTVVDDQNKEVLAKDMLFATLQTSSRICLCEPFSYILTDTVGFISDLPTYLVKAFRSTLEEIKEADLLLMVIDLSDPNYEKHIVTTFEVLEDLGCLNVPIVKVYNKADLVDLSEYPIEDNSIVTSCKTGYNISELRDLIRGELYKTKVVKMLIPFEDYKWYQIIRDNCLILENKEVESGLELVCEIKIEDVQKYSELILK